MQCSAEYYLRWIFNRWYSVEGEIDEEEVRKHPFEQELPQRVYYQDGSVGDW